MLVCNDFSTQHHFSAENAAFQEFGLQKFATSSEQAKVSQKSLREKEGKVPLHTLQNFTFLADKVSDLLFAKSIITNI